MSTFFVKIQNPNGKGKSLKVNTSDKISTAKINAGQVGYVWKFNGEVIKDDKTIEYYGIEEDDCIISNTPAPGGEDQKIKRIYNN